MMLRRAVLAAAFAALAFAPAAPAQEIPVPLLSGAATTVIDAPGDKLAVTRRRTIAFDQAGLEALRAGRDLRLNLFADVSLPALVNVHTSIEEPSLF